MATDKFVPDNSCKECLFSLCTSVFDRVVISNLIRGGTRIMWELLDTFTDPTPLLFQLQVGTTDNPLADDWANVGLPVENAYYAIDGEQRVWGKTNWSHYRVKLTTLVGVYYSDPVAGMGTLDFRDWRRAREIIRKERLDGRLASQDGYLLKRRVTGKRCTVCLDPQTQDVRNPDCLSCFGTSFECGYYYPMACVWAKMSPKSRRVERDAGQSRGTVGDIVIKARMLAIDLLMEDDVWVNKKTDDRYYVHRIDNISEWRGVALIADVELRPVPFSSVVYAIDVPQQLAALGY